MHPFILKISLVISIQNEWRVEKRSMRLIWVGDLNNQVGAECVSILLLTDQQLSVWDL